MFDCFTFAKLGCFVKQTKNIFFFTSQNLGVVASDLIFTSVL